MEADRGVGQAGSDFAGASVLDDVDGNQGWQEGERVTAGTNGQVCGNCGATVPTEAITCPECGVLLAAYQAAGGSESLTIVVPEIPDASDIPVAEMTPPASPPAVEVSPTTSGRPAGSSPIGDALRRSRAEVESHLSPGEAGARSAGDDLASMASADDLSAMADGDDDLAEMAAGNDELAAMAGGGASTSFEEAVNAELAGAKVVYEGGTPVIEAADVEVIEPGDGPPVVIEHAAPATPPSSASRPMGTDRPAPEDRGRARPAQAISTSGGTSGQQVQSTGSYPSRVPAAPSWQSIPGGKQSLWPQDKPRPEIGKMAGPLMAIPFLLIVCVILGAGRGVGGFLFISLITMVIIVYLLVRAARMAVRKTSSMPRDDGQSR